MHSYRADPGPGALFALAFPFLLAACGGGGGGGGGAAAVAAPTPAPTAVSTARPPVAVSSTEVSRSAYATQSGAKAAWDQGYAGKGVTVAILDSGIASGVGEFAGRIHRDSGNFTEDAQGRVIKNQPVADDQGHGTWVASVVGSGADGQGTVGIAPEATILALGFYGKADMTQGSAMWISLDRLSTALAQSRTAGAAVVNGSFSIDGDHASLRSALQQSVAAGQLLVFAAGNDGQANPGLPARYAKESWANGQIVAVGAVDSSNVITAYSNRAGDALQFYLVAPGTVSATNKDGAVDRVMGTSFASPQVAGAAALVKQKWPLLTAPQIANVLFASATDLGDPGTDPIYGRGLLNIDKAMQPIGQPAIAVPGGGSAPLAATGLTLPAGGVAANLGRAAARGDFTVAAVDSFGRDFRTDLAPRVSRTAGFLESDFQQAMARDLHGVDRSIGSMRFSVLPVALAAGDRTAITARSYFGYGEQGSWQFAGGSTDRLGQFFGLESRPGGQAHPFFQYARDGRFAGTGFALSDHARVRAGTLASDTASGQVMDFAYSSRSRLQPRPEAGDWALSLTAGGLAERDRLLGMAGSGAFALGGGRSGFTTLGGRYWLDAKTDLGGTLTLGRTEGAGAGLLRFSPLLLWSAEAQVARTDNWLRGDRLSLTLGKPLGVAGGSLAMTLPVRLAADGTLGFRESRLGLGNGGGETRVGFAYSAPASKTGKLLASGVYRFNADNEPGRRESILGVQYHLPF